MKEIISLGAVIKQLQKTYTGLKHVRLDKILGSCFWTNPDNLQHRVPVCNSGSPNPGDFDRMANAMTGTCFAAPVIINCQVLLQGFVNHSESQFAFNASLSILSFVFLIG